MRPVQMVSVLSNGENKNSFIYLINLFIMVNFFHIACFYYLMLALTTPLFFLFILLLSGGIARF